jgi:hypothetical protein
MPEDGRPRDEVPAEPNERARQYAREVEYLYRTALDLVAFPPDRDVYPYVAERLKDLAGDIIVAVSSYDAETGLIECRAVAGLGRFAEGMLKLLGRSPVGMRFPISQEALEGLCKGNRRDTGRRDGPPPRLRPEACVQGHRGQLPIPGKSILGTQLVQVEHLVHERHHPSPATFA